MSATSTDAPALPQVPALPAAPRALPNGASADSAAGATDQVSFKTWVAVVGSTLGAFLAILNIQVVGASLADIQGGIGAGIDDGGWITTSYLIAEIIVIPLSGWLASVFSLRAYLLTSTALFLGLTAACAFAENLGQMIAIRAAQGFAGGVLIPLAFTIIMTKLPRSKHAIGLAIYSVSVVFAPSIGPALGGYFSDNFGWQSIFFLSLPPGVVMIAMLWYALEPAPRQLHLLARGDWLGVVSMALGLGCLETVLEEGNKDDWFGSPLILRLTIVGVVSLALFVYVELKRSAPLLQLRLLARRNFGFGTCANFVFGFSMFGWIYLIPQYLSRLQGYSSQEIGGVMVWLGLPQLLLIPFIPKVMQRIQPYVLVIIGYSLFMGGSLLAMRLSDDFSGPQFLASSLVRALAQAMTMAPLSVIAIAGIGPEFAGSASALFNATRNLGGAVGIALLQTILTKREQFHSNVLSSQVSVLTPETRQRLDRLVDYFLTHGANDRGGAYREAVVTMGRAIRHQAFLLGFSDTIVVQSAVLGLGLAAALFLRKASASSAAGGAH
ncbi:MAG: DHA2 family efflux MFS transporter permease subunit [Steroidobacteraceae bacterium]|jgi:DHA2 family multidrug resistance protein